MAPIGDSTLAGYVARLTSLVLRLHRAALVGFITVSGSVYWGWVEVEGFETPFRSEPGRRRKSSLTQ